MLIKCLGGPCDGQVIDIPQENDDCRLPSVIPMPYKVDDTHKFTRYELVIENGEGWTKLYYTPEE